MGDVTVPGCDRSQAADGKMYFERVCARCAHANTSHGGGFGDRPESPFLLMERSYDNHCGARESRGKIRGDKA